jgi:plastocyanin domain-containing protein
MIYGGRAMKSLVVLGLLAGPLFADTPKPARFDISVTRKGFQPGEIDVPAKTPVTLVFTRKTNATCTKSVVVTLGDGKTLERELPLDEPVAIDVTFPRPGKLGYACSMDMNKGVIVVR